MMIAVLLILIAFSLLTLLLGYARGYAYLARWVAAAGAGVALAAHLATEGLQGAGVAGTGVGWPPFMELMERVGGVVYHSDALAAGLGAWCLLLGGVCLLAGERTASRSGGYALQPAANLLAIATLYSLVYTWDLRAFAVQMLLLLSLLWAANGLAQDPQPVGNGLAQDPQPVGNGPAERRVAYSIGLGLGGLCIVAAVLVMGQVTGGRYNLTEISLSALTRLPLSLIAIGAALWLGLVPATGWSASGYSTGANAALAQSLVLGVPITVLLLRLQALLSAQGLSGSVPAEWSAFTGALAWAGGLTALAAGAGTILAAGGPRWTALLTAHSLGLATWALGLDTPEGRQVALAILLAFGAGRVAFELASTASGFSGFTQLMPFRGRSPDSGPGYPALVLVAGLSLAAAPLTAGFVGPWLLAATLSQPARPSIAIALLGAVILCACGTALHLGRVGAIDRSPGGQSVNGGQPAGSSGWLGWVALAGAVALVVGGVAPGLWLPRVASMAGAAGGSSAIALPWAGVSGGGGLLAPLPLLGLAALALAGIAWLVSAWMGSGATYAGILLPTASLRASPKSKVQSPKFPEPDFGLWTLDAERNAPAPIWWISLTWVEEGLWGFGGTLARLGARAGLGLGRLEGKYQLPLALVLIMVALLAVIR